MVTLDSRKNFAIANVNNVYDESATEIELTTGAGSKFPDATTPYNLVWWNSSDYTSPSDDPNAEIVRVTGRTDDTLTITRAQESTSATTKNTTSKIYKVMLGLTSKVLDDIETAFNDIETIVNNLSLASIASLSTDTTKSLYTIPEDADVEYRTSGGITAQYIKDSNGYIGYGTVPYRPISVKDAGGNGFQIGLDITSATRGIVFIQDNTAHKIINYESGKPFQIYVGGSLRHEIDSSGNTTIGSNFYYDAVNNRLSIGAGTSPVNVLDAGANTVRLGIVRMNYINNYTNSYSVMQTDTGSANAKFFGKVAFNSSSAPLASVHGRAGSASDIVGILQGTTSQTGNLLEFQDVNGNFLNYADSAGTLISRGTYNATYGRYSLMKYENGKLKATRTVDGTVNASIYTNEATHSLTWNIDSGAGETMFRYQGSIMASIKSGSYRNPDSGQTAYLSLTNLQTSNIRAQSNNGISSYVDDAVGSDIGFSFERSARAPSGSLAITKWIWDGNERGRMTTDGTFKNVGGRIKPPTRYTSTDTIETNDYEVFGNTDSGSFTLTLPVGSDGMAYRIVNTGTSGNTLTIARGGTNKLLGGTSGIDLADGESLVIVFDATDNWY